MGETVKENLGYIEKGWLGVKNAIMGAWDAAKAFGREETMSEQTHRNQSEIGGFKQCR